MSTSLLHAVARRAESLIPDADLLVRFTRDRSQSAFEELVRRHGPLVWAVCRHLLPDHADAEDAFQAVFLAFVRSGASIRDGRALPAWLHGVAVRVATRAKREGARRRARERTAALPEADRPVADGTWEALVRAAHEEVQRLPEAERTAFVLCDLEGVSQSDAAARLGWPLGSLSGRLCKARQRLLNRLAERGIAPVAAVGIGLTAGTASALPERLAAAVKSFPAAPGTASAVVQGLARGLTEVFTMRVKMMAVATVMVAAIGLTGSAVLLSQDKAPSPSAGGLSPRPSATGVPSSAGGLPPGTGGLPAGAGVTPQPKDVPGGRPPAREVGGNAAGAPSAWAGGFAGSRSPSVEYKFVDIHNDRKAFEDTITQQGKEGWEFCGSERFGATPKNPTELVLVFKKAKGVASGFGGAGALSDWGIGGFGGSSRGPQAAPGTSAPVGGDSTARVVPLKNVNAEDAAKAIQKQFEKGVRVAAERSANALVIVSADPDVLQRVLKVIAELDAKAAKSVLQDGAPVVIGIVNARATELEPVLKKVFPDVSITGEARSNSLIVRAEHKLLEQIRDVIKALDVPPINPPGALYPEFNKP